LRLSSFYTGLAKVYLNKAKSINPNPFRPTLPEVNNAIDCFRKAVFNDPNNQEAWKLLGYVLTQVGQQAEAQAAWQKAKTLAPNDPDLQPAAAHK
jgi:cytochrome c-type biogenesis protein CcmH/NrfG